MANNLIKGTITLIDDSLHNLDYHELRNAEGEAWWGVLALEWALTGASWGFLALRIWQVLSPLAIIFPPGCGAKALNAQKAPRICLTEQIRGVVY